MQLVFAPHFLAVDFVWKLYHIERRVPPTVKYIAKMLQEKLADHSPSKESSCIHFYGSMIHSKNKAVHKHAFTAINQHYPQMLPVDLEQCSTGEVLDLADGEDVDLPNDDEEGQSQLSDSIHEGAQLNPAEADSDVLSAAPEHRMSPDPRRTSSRNVCFNDILNEAMSAGTRPVEDHEQKERARKNKELCRQKNALYTAIGKLVVESIQRPKKRKSWIISSAKDYAISNLKRRIIMLRKTKQHLDIGKLVAGSIVSPKERRRLLRCLGKHESHGTA